MRLLIRYILLILFLAKSINATAQNVEDTTFVFELKDLFSIIFNYHPVASQADLLPEQAKQRIRAARGAFDPSIHSVANEKTFKDTRYYTVWDSELRIPTWYGLDLKAGYELSNGRLLNPQNVVPDAGLFYAGFSVPIGQGMVIDQRRAVLRQAQIFSEIADAERLMVLNDLLLRASIDYWDWMYQFNRYRLFQEGYEFAVIRYNAVRERVIYGDLAPIDSVEAVIEVQLRQQNLDQSRIDFNNSILRLSNHLWGENNVPLEMSPNIRPQNEPYEQTLISMDELEQMVTRSKEGHPLLQAYRGKLSQLDVERRFKADLLKPRINLHVNLLQNAAAISTENVNMNYFSNNYKIGGSVSYPLLLRRQRGELKLTKLYIQDTELEISMKTREISNKIRAVYNELVNYATLVTTQERMVSNYIILRNGEESRFRNGESSLFLINTRETQLINSQIKFFELQSKYALSQTKLNWEAGTLGLDQ
jgi:outer membrane protein TolC